MRFLETVTLGEVTIVVGGLLLLAGVLRKIWPFIRKLVSLVDALDSLPTQVAKIDKFGTAVDGLAESVGWIRHEVTPNHGGSIKDAVKRLEQSTARIEIAQGEQVKDIGGLRAEVRKTRDRLDKHLDQ